MTTKSTSPTVSGSWLLSAVGISMAAAALCGWLTLCLLFWQGSWQLLYHPSSAVTRTPAASGIPFEPVAFAATEAGVPRLKGWWIPAAPSARYARFTVLYLHGKDGNLGDSVEELSALHGLGVNVFAFDYRGYGQSQFAHPSEERWREDAQWALAYLTGTRHVATEAIVLDGKELGANLALEIGAEHPELAGVVLQSPLSEPAKLIFGDPRARLVPARLLVHDRYDSGAFADSLRTPSLWLTRSVAEQIPGKQPPGYGQVRAEKLLVWVSAAGGGAELQQAYSRWLDGLADKQKAK